MGLHKLRKLADWQLSNPRQDIRGRSVYDQNGDRLGRVEELLVDTDDELVKWVVLDDGRRVEAAGLSIEDDGVFIDPNQKIVERRTPPI